METLQIVGYLAACLGAMSLIPEVIKALRTHHLQDVSWGTLLLLLLSSILWGIYGICTKDIPLGLSASVNFAMDMTLMTLKRHYDVTGQPLLLKDDAKPRETQKILAPETVPETSDEETTGQINPD